MNEDEILSIRRRILLDEDEGAAAAAFPLTPGAAISIREDEYSALNALRIWMQASV
jgi:hypothetical protein